MADNVFTVTHPCFNPKCPEKSHTIDIPENLIIGLTNETLTKMNEFGQTISEEHDAKEGAIAIMAISIAMSVVGRIVREAYPFLADTMDICATKALSSAQVSSVVRDANTPVDKSHARKTPNHLN